MDEGVKVPKGLERTRRVRQRGKVRIEVAVCYRCSCCGRLYRCWPSDRGMHCAACRYYNCPEETGWGLGEDCRVPNR